MKKLASLIAISMLAAGASPALATDLASNITTQFTTAGSNFNYGQSFSVLGSGSFNNVVINLYRNGSVFANGDLYLFSSAYTGTPANLASTTTNRIGVANAANNLYTFAQNVVLTGGSQYFFYTDNLNYEINFNVSSYTSGTLVQSGNRQTEKFYNVNPSDVAFRVTGNVINGAVPEPASWMMMILGFGVVGYAMRRKTVLRFV
ncbi:hypothetical protein GCM10022253_26810 [Sphingomonas endophytica]|uniref:Ice-binding protein C-terminal domain-containing protein n=1 Tax=Sphingomonas endophytica TaxID=869719 RepID=A0ABR6N9Q8_9SPHN|nr:PEPxxWA-CTERM sorting domain-containing protein [Sphingomonas endophytica]MBB5727537.1 hypothetical protein [Sphingomonas endophytica]